MKKNNLIWAVLLLSAHTAFAQVECPQRGFISTSQAKTWEEGLISGNGTIGTNVFGNPTDETIIFTHERMFLPKNHLKSQKPVDQSQSLFEIRRLIDQGMYKEATCLQLDYAGIGNLIWPDPFVPVCDLNIHMPASGTVKDYIRSVNFENGEATVSWSDERGTYERNVFVSRADSIAVIRIKAAGSGKVNCEIAFHQRTLSDKLAPNYINGNKNIVANYLKDIETGKDGEFIYYRHAFAKAYPSSIQSIAAYASIKVKGGSCHTDTDRYIVENADEVLLFVDVKPNYFIGKSDVEGMKRRLTSVQKNYGDLLASHAAIHGELFNRMRLDLGGGKDRNLTTEELIAKSTNENINNALVEKEFDAGRYNIISSIGELPPVLQGLWAGTFVPDWSSDFTQDGNLPAAISSLLMGNCPELMRSYISYIEYLVPFLEVNARNLFGCRGVILPFRSTTNGYNSQMRTYVAGGFWTAGAAWAAHFFYDYYLYTGDKDFLREHALPYMEKVVAFFEDFLYLGPDGKYKFSPGVSPENTPLNSNSWACYNATMDVAAAKEAITNTIAASRILKVNKDKIDMWEEMLEKMPDYMIDENGMFKEWLTPELKNQDNHRHASHLYPVYDNFPKEFAENPDLADAVRNGINFKLDRHWRGNQLGFMSFGLVQLGMSGASIGDKEIVHECLKHLINRFWLNNMASTHNHRSLFNMDISGGMPAVIIKMLVYSDPGLVKLLPALPDIWGEGSMEGILCRGQIEIEKLIWNKSSVEVTMTSKVNQKINLVCGNNSRKVSLKADHPLTVKMDR